MTYEDLTKEQQMLIDKAKNGENVLVDACIGSGKTTAIQVMCNEITNKNIVYLTYNRLLKLDAKEKIKSKNVIVQNYHGFAYILLNSIGITVGKSDLIQTFNRIRPKKFNIDLLVIDEYQDIEQELAEMLNILKAQNPWMQIIAVGDMQQKIYDKTKLDVYPFITQFLGNHSLLQFTTCFRLNASHAEKLGRVWEKKINGANKKCKVMEMTLTEALNFIREQDPSDLLCLGPRTGIMPYALNLLEKQYPEKFNKSTVYASIRAEDQGMIAPTKDVAIFTTFDSSKGLERKACLIFGFDEAYWQIRLKNPDAKYDIIRNIFLVAASRGKEYIIFVKGKKDHLLSEESLSTRPEAECSKIDFSFRMSEMFDFKYKEDIEDCFSLLKVKKKTKKDNTRIYIKNNDEMIDLSPCIGIYQSAHFFKKYNIDEQISFAQEVDDVDIKIIGEDATLDEKILAYTAYETKLSRYVNQVSPPFVTEEQAEEIDSRLKTKFSKNDEVEIECGFTLEYEDEKPADGSGIKQKHILYVFGKADVLKKELVYELKFTSELEHTHFLQLACYLAAMHKEKGILWNVQTNETYEISVPDREKFLIAVARTITKGAAKKAREIDYVTRQEWSKRKKDKLRIGDTA